MIRMILNLHKWRSLFVLLLFVGCSQDDVTLYDTATKTPAYSADLDTEGCSLYALTVVGPDISGVMFEDSQRYHTFLLAYGYNDKVSSEFMASHNSLFLIEPTEEELRHVVDELMKYTDYNDVLRYGVIAHGTSDRIRLWRESTAHEVVNIFKGDDYGRQDIDINTCFSKRYIDLIDAPNTIAMGPSWNDEITNAVISPLKRSFVRDYWQAHGSNADKTIGSGRWNIHNNDMTVRKLFLEIHDALVPGGNLRPETRTFGRSYPYLRITDSYGNTEAYSTREGEIIGSHFFLDQIAMPTKWDIEMGYNPAPHP